MAGFNIHLAIAKRFLEKNKLNNCIDIYKGVIDPDFVDDKSITHFSKRIKDKNLVERLKTQVSLYNFLCNNEIDSNYNKGIFIHLLTDYLFFNNFFEKEYIINTSYEEFAASLYYSYDKTNKFLEEKYNISSILNNIDLKIYKDKIESNYRSVDGECKLIIDENKIYEFIEFVSDIDIEKYRDKILENKCNVLP